MKKVEEKKPFSIDFRKIETTDLAGHRMTFDVAKNLGNFIYQVTPDLGMFELAQRIYKDGEVVIEDEQKAGLIAIMKIPQCPFIAMIKTKIIAMLCA
jgi:hypothetical protein